MVVNGSAAAGAVAVTTRQKWDGRASVNRTTVSPPTVELQGSGERNLAAGGAVRRRRSSSRGTDDGRRRVT